MGWETPNPNPHLTCQSLIFLPLRTHTRGRGATRIETKKPVAYIFTLHIVVRGSMQLNTGWNFLQEPWLKYTPT